MLKRINMIKTCLKKIYRYANEFQNLLGLPFTEDNALGETLRIKRPHQECFNCLALSHRVTECPIKIDDERIRLHRQLFNTQSQQAIDQAQLFSTRYTSSSEGARPGKVSAHLREALGIRDNQIPVFIYRMREVGYPIGWLLEARVHKSKLAVHDGQTKDIEETKQGLFITFIYFSKTNFLKIF